MRDTRAGPLLVLLAVAMSSCTGGLDRSGEAWLRSRAPAPAPAEPRSASLAVPGPPVADGALRWTIPTSLGPEDWYLAIQSWNAAESGRVMLQAQPAALAYLE